MNANFAESCPDTVTPSINNLGASAVVHTLLIRLGFFRDIQAMTAEGNSRMASIQRKRNGKVVYGKFAARDATFCAEIAADIREMSRVLSTVASRIVIKQTIGVN